MMFITKRDAYLANLPVGRQVPFDQKTIINKQMNIEQLRDYCLSKTGAEETLPFGPDTLVYKVGGKIFLLTGLDNEGLRFNVK